MKTFSWLPKEFFIVLPGFNLILCFNLWGSLFGSSSYTYWHLMFRVLWFPCSPSVPCSSSLYNSAIPICSVLYFFCIFWCSAHTLLYSLCFSWEFSLRIEPGRAWNAEFHRQLKTTTNHVSLKEGPIPCPILTIVFTCLILLSFCIFAHL